MPKSYAMTLTGVAYAGNYGKIVRHDASGTIALATDASAQQPCGVVYEGDHYKLTRSSVITFGPARGLVGSAGLAVGFRYLTCDADSKLKVAGDGDAVVGYGFVPSALTENETFEFIVCPSLGAPAT